MSCRDWHDRPAGARRFPLDASAGAPSVWVTPPVWLSEFGRGNTRHCTGYSGKNIGGPRGIFVTPINKKKQCLASLPHPPFLSHVYIKTAGLPSPPFLLIPI